MFIINEQSLSKRLSPAKFRHKIQVIQYPTPIKLHLYCMIKKDQLSWLSLFLYNLNSGISMMDYQQMNKFQKPNPYQLNHKHYTASKNPDSLQSRLLSIQKKMQEGIAKNKSQLATVHRNAKQLLIKTQQDNKRYEKQAQIQLQRLKDVNMSINEQLEMALAERKQREETIITLFQSKVDILRKQIDEQRKCRKQFFSQISESLEEDMPTIMDEVIIGKDEVEKEQEKLEESMEEVMGQTLQFFEQFIEEQQEGTKKAADMLRNLKKKVNQKMQEQKQACEQTYEDVLKYIEETCSHLDEDREVYWQNQSMDKI